MDKGTVKGIVRRKGDAKKRGDYFLFGRKSDGWNLQTLRDCFSYILQNIFLLPKNINEIVACGKEHDAGEEVIKIGKAANFHYFIRTLPQGYDDKK